MTVAHPLEEQFAQRDRDDDRIDTLQRELLAAAVHQGARPDAVRLGIDVAPLTRFMERFADQAVSVARRLDLHHHRAPVLCAVALRRLPHPVAADVSATTCPGKGR